MPFEQSTGLYGQSQNANQHYAGSLSQQSPWDQRHLVPTLSILPKVHSILAHPTFPVWPRHLHLRMASYPQVLQLLSAHQHLRVWMAQGLRRQSPPKPLAQQDLCTCPSRCHSYWLNITHFSTSFTHDWVHRLEAIQAYVFIPSFVAEISTSSSESGSTTSTFFHNVPQYFSNFARSFDNSDQHSGLDVCDRI